MTHIGSNSLACLAILLGLSLAALPATTPAPAKDRIILAGEPSKGLPTCEEFYDKWDVPGAPSGILAMAGLGREVIAAKDCIDKNNVPMACKHWQGLLAIVDKMGPPLDETRGDIEQLMQQHKCAEAPAPASNPAPAPDSQAGPDTDSVPDHDPGSDTETSPDAPE